MTIPKKTAQAIAADEAEMATLKRRITELGTRDRELLKIQIAQEKTHSPAAFAAAVDKAQAMALLAGEPFAATREKPVSPLEATLAERKAIAAAVKIASDRYDVLSTERSDRIWASFSTESAAIEKRRVMAAFELQRINRAREKLREKIQLAGGAGYFASDGPDLGGLGGDPEVDWAAKRLVDDGIATKAEIERARSDG
jgi:hypothetical protein